MKPNNLATTKNTNVSNRSSRLPFFRIAPTPLAAALVFAASLSLSAGAAVLVNDREIQSTVTVTEQAVRDGSLITTIENNGRERVGEIEVLVTYNWLWKDDRRPGNDNPGWAEYVTVVADVDPGASIPFTYKPERMLPDRNDGHFMPVATVVGYTPYKTNPSR